MSESFEILVKPDGTVNLKTIDFPEGEGLVELDKIIARMNGSGLQVTKGEVQQVYTGEYHKHEHTHGVHEHH